MQRLHEESFTLLQHMLDESPRFRPEVDPVCNNASSAASEPLRTCGQYEHNMICCEKNYYVELLPPLSEERHNLFNTVWTLNTVCGSDLSGSYSLSALIRKKPFIS